MSETEQALPAGPSAGAMLRAAREQAGVHIASLAVALKVPVARLEALEAERFDLLPDPPFVRALAGGVCRALKLDPGPVLARLPQKNPPQLAATVERSDRTTFRTTTAAPAGLAGIGSGARHPVFWVVVVILLAAATLLLVPAARLDAWMQAVLGTPRTEDASAPVGGNGDQQTLPGEPPVAAVAPMGPESTRGEPQSAAGASASSAPAVAASESALQSSAAMTTAATPASSPATGAAGEGVVTFTATDASWIRVTDSRGTTVMEKVLQPGSQLSANGTPPLSVVVGNAGATSVQVRGKAFDLSAITRNNVARFEVR
ncbi:helix-turn-helix domain-containing protein [Xylophilus sp. GOD-11R]|uniref:helix-turn-helix domain-containing protein n=1 Tax=Xylophilus sp. GOD-11R TaxID=3089814 RepID=UPI00298CFAFC|nr:helix-turn-helix domain-containing protein [Xylophilus sp. GOD-11R]WPB55091.1 helix-turn-helix domain-containing protein [Xylophilus sp. GOD-11R]